MLRKRKRKIVVIDGRKVENLGLVIGSKFSLLETRCELVNPPHQTMKR